MQQKCCEGNNWRGVGVVVGFRPGRLSRGHDEEVEPHESLGTAKEHGSMVKMYGFGVRRSRGRHGVGVLRAKLEEWTGAL